jgi:hypothetical protein
VGSAKRDVDGWASLKVLAAVRDVLGGGMQVHLLQVRTLVSIFC